MLANKIKRVLARRRSRQNAWRFINQLNSSMKAQGSEQANKTANDLEAYFDRNLEGPGIWKWRHYFDIYDRHFSKFRGKPVNVMEIGIYSGGSLGMWRSYFGDSCNVYGVDIEPACRAYESENIQVLIGDQSDREFWRSSLRSLPPIDIVIDDGGHLPSQQMITLEEVFPHIKAGGVYLCEDVHGVGNLFAAYTHAIADSINHCRHVATPRDNDGVGKSEASISQRHICSVCYYPFATVIEKNESPRNHLVSQKNGSQWQPFL